MIEAIVKTINNDQFSEFCADFIEDLVIYSEFETIYDLKNLVSKIINTEVQILLKNEDYNSEYLKESIMYKTLIEDKSWLEISNYFAKRDGLAKIAIYHPSKGLVKPKVLDIDLHIGLRDIADVLIKRGISSHQISEICEDLMKINKNLRLSPDKAPELWAERNKADGEKIGEFIKRLYGYAFGNDFHTGTLQRLDKAASVAYDRWLKDVAKGKAELLPGFPLPTSDEWKASQAQLTPGQLEQARRQLWQEYAGKQRNR